MKKKLILTLFICVIIACIIISPEIYIKESYFALTVWAKVLLPSLLPFFVFTKLLTNMGYVNKISYCCKGFCKKCYNTPPISAYVFLMSILTGYPVGSKVVADLYKDKHITKQQAKTTITFTSNSGPMFIVGSVAVSMLCCKAAGLIMLISHILGAMINGLFYKCKEQQKNASQIKHQSIKSNNYSTYKFNLGEKTNQINSKNKLNNPSQTQTLSQTVTESVSSILCIGGIICICFVILKVLNNLHFFDIFANALSFAINPQITKAVLNGVVEITKGCLMISTLNVSMLAKVCLANFVIAFGGISTAIQAMAFLNNITSFGFFLKQKLTHSIISTAICVVLCLIFL